MQCTGPGCTSSELRSGVVSQRFQVLRRGPGVGAPVGGLNWSTTDPEIPGACICPGSGPRSRLQSSDQKASSTVAVPHAVREADLRRSGLISGGVAVLGRSLRLTHIETPIQQKEVP